MSLLTTFADSMKPDHVPATVKATPRATPANGGAASVPPVLISHACPLAHLNAHAIGVFPVAGKGLNLIADFAVSNELRGHIILWALGEWAALMTALGWTGPELPKRIRVTSLNLYQLPKEVPSDR